MDNSSRGPLRVPGFGGIPIHYVLPGDKRFAHGVNDWEQVPIITARELAMVAVMNTLTDKPEWQIKIFDDQIVDGWRKEAFATTPLMSEQAWNWCVAELRDKAIYFEQNQYLRVLDTGSCICKSDTLVPESLESEFKSRIAPLLEQVAKGLQPESDAQVLDLVDPSLFPLVYGRSLVLGDGGKVDLDNVFGFYGQAKQAPKHLDRRFDPIKEKQRMERGWKPSEALWINAAYSPEFFYWSSNFQWLPSEVEFLNGSGTDVHITSYINNLHPTHKSLYRSIEKLISLTIKPWNDCLIQGQQILDHRKSQAQRGRVPLRILTYGVEWENELPEWALAFRHPSPTRKRIYLKWMEILRNIPEDAVGVDNEIRAKAKNRVEGMPDMRGRENLELPAQDLWRMAKEYLELPQNGSTTPSHLPKDWARDEYTAFWFIERKHKDLIYFRHPEPGVAFSYEDWKANNGNKAVVDMDLKRPISGLHPEGVYHVENSDHKQYTVTLQDTFRTQGLQIMVKIGSIELTADKPVFGGSSWQLEGQMNEHIVATAMYAYDVKNVTKSGVSFRQQTLIHSPVYRYARHRRFWDILSKPAHEYGKDQFELEALSEIFGFKDQYLRAEELGAVYDDLPFQNIGCINMTQGRLITFPHTMEHRMEPFELVDPSLPGHHRFVVIYLVDPHYRVCSTRNVPPQQHHWWADAVGNDFVKLGIPREISTDISSRTGDWLMGMEEATKHKLDMMKEHRWMREARLKGKDSKGFLGTHGFSGDRY